MAGLASAAAAVVATLAEGSVVDPAAVGRVEIFSEKFIGICDADD